MGRPTFESITYDGYNDQSVSHTLSTKANRFVFAAMLDAAANTDVVSQSGPTYNGTAMTELTSYAHQVGSDSRAIKFAYHQVDAADSGAVTVAASDGTHAGHNVLFVFEFSNVSEVKNDVGTSAQGQTQAINNLGDNSVTICATRSNVVINPGLDSSGTIMYTTNNNPADDRFDSGFAVAYHDTDGNFTWDWNRDSVIAAFEIVGTSGGNQIIWML